MNKPNNNNINEELLQNMFSNITLGNSQFTNQFSNIEKYNGDNYYAINPNKSALCCSMACKLNLNNNVISSNYFRYGNEYSHCPHYYFCDHCIQIKILINNCKNNCKNKLLYCSKCNHNYNSYILTKNLENIK